MLRQRNIMTNELMHMMEGLIAGPNDAEQQQLATLSKRRFTLIYLRSIIALIIVSILMIILNGESIIKNLNTLINFNITEDVKYTFTQR